MSRSQYKLIIPESYKMLPDSTLIGSRDIQQMCSYATTGCVDGAAREGRLPKPLAGENKPFISRKANDKNYWLLGDLREFEKLQENTA